MPDQLDLIVKLVEGVSKNVDDLRESNKCSHDTLTLEIKNMRADVNGLKEFKAKLLGISAGVAFAVSFAWEFLSKKMEGK